MHIIMSSFTFFKKIGTLYINQRRSQNKNSYFCRITASLHMTMMEDFFYFTKGQRRGIIVFLVIIIAIIVFKWII